jgi:hypothetical protein
MHFFYGPDFHMHRISVMPSFLAIKVIPCGRRPGGGGVQWLPLAVQLKQQLLRLIGPLQQVFAFEIVSLFASFSHFPLVIRLLASRELQLIA